MPPLAHIKIRLKQLIEVAQQVFIKRCRHAQRVVVGGFKRGTVLDQVNTQQQALCTASRGVAQLLQKRQALHGREVAQAGTRVEKHPVMGLYRVRQNHLATKIHAHANDVQRRKAGLHPLGRGAQEITGDIHRDILAWQQLRYQRLGLGAIASPQINQAGMANAAAPDGGGHLRLPNLKNTGLGPRWVVLVQFGDRFKQAATQRVVEKLGRNAGRFSQQALRQFKLDIAHGCAWCFAQIDEPWRACRQIFQGKQAMYQG